MLGAFWHNLPLTKYLIEQLAMTHGDRMDELRKFYKEAKNEDWELMVAGQRVQIIKKNVFEKGTLEFGTEVVHSKDGSITCLLGASPGASTAVYVMLDVLETAFPELVASPEGSALLKNIVASWKTEVNEEHFKKELERTTRILGL